MLAVEILTGRTACRSIYSASTVRVNRPAQQSVRWREVENRNRRAVIPSPSQYPMLMKRHYEVLKYSLEENQLCDIERRRFEVERTGAMSNFEAYPWRGGVDCLLTYSCGSAHLRLFNQMHWGRRGKYSSSWCETDGCNSPAENTMK